MPISHLTSAFKGFDYSARQGTCGGNQCPDSMPPAKAFIYNHEYTHLRISTINNVIARPGQQILKSPKLVYITIVLVKIHFVVKTIRSNKKVTQNVKFQSK